VTAPRSVRLYTRPGCHLCDQARQILQSLRRQYRFSVEEVDISVDRDAFLRYWAAIPVIEVGESLVPAALDEARVRSVFDWEFRDEPDDST
jgi:hypothetical protein